MTNNIPTETSNSKKFYFDNLPEKLSNPKLNRKAYWDILKIFERLIFNILFNYFIENNLLSPHQSGFIPSDSCVQQLISITHEIYNAFDCNPSLEVRGAFLDISKAFDKV